MLNVLLKRKIYLVGFLYSVVLVICNFKISNFYWYGIPNNGALVFSCYFAIFIFIVFMMNVVCLYIYLNMEVGFGGSL